MSKVIIFGKSQLSHEPLVHMAAMGKTKIRSLPENTSLTADQQYEFDLKVKNIKQKVYLK